VKQTYKKIVKHFGVEHQKNKAIEELSELIRAISRNDRDNVIEEIADVEIVINQLKYIYKIKDGLIDIIKDKKENRTIRLIIN